MKINLQIERLVLHGIQLTLTDRVELAAAIQTELGRLLASAGDSQPWMQLGNLDHIQARSITYQPGSSSIRLGQEIAASLYDSTQTIPTDKQSVKS